MAGFPVGQGWQGRRLTIPRFQRALKSSVRGAVIFELRSENTRLEYMARLASGFLAPWSPPQFQAFAILLLESSSDHTEPNFAAKPAGRSVGWSVGRLAARRANRSGSGLGYRPDGWSPLRQRGAMQDSRSASIQCFVSNQHQNALLRWREQKRDLITNIRSEDSFPFAQ